MAVIMTEPGVVERGLIFFWTITPYFDYGGVRAIDVKREREERIVGRDLPSWTWPPVLYQAAITRDFIEEI